jgi:hypothetical protein
MALEHERPIEKHLHAVAQKRRDEAGNSFTLHPANRRLLHDEIARKYARNARQPRSFFGLGAKLWPGFAIGLAALVLLASGSWLFISSQHRQKSPTLLAKSETDRTVPAAAPTMAPQSESAPKEKAREELTRLDSTEQATALSKKEAGLQFRDALADKAGRSAEPNQQVVGQSINMPTPVASAPPQKELAGSAALPDQAAAARAAGEAFARRYGLANPTPSKDASPLALTPGSSSSSSSQSQVRPQQTTAPLAENASQQQVARGLLGIREFSKAPTDSMDASVQRTLFMSVGNSFQNANRSQSLAEQETRLKSATTDNASSIKVILPSFAVEQSGPALRVIDADGSVYSGYLQPSTGQGVEAKTVESLHGQAAVVQSDRQRTQLTATPGAPAAQSAENLSPGSQSYFFNVVGTNRSLNQQVVFSGNLVALTNSAPLDSNASLAGAAPPQKVQNTSQSQNASQSLLRISGKAVIGQKDELQIEAVPVPNN